MWREAGSGESIFVSEYNASNRMLRLLAPAAGQDNDISESADLFPSGESLTIIYLDATSKPMRDCVRISLP